MSVVALSARCTSRNGVLAVRAVVVVAVVAGALHAPTAAEIAFGSRFVSLPAGGQPQAVAATDLDGDGHVDLLVTQTGEMVRPDSILRVFRGDGRGRFAAADDVPVGAAPVGVGSADWNRDGKPDVAVANSGRGTVSVFYGEAGGALRTGPRVAGGLRPILAVPLDVDGDRHPDLVVVNMGNGRKPSTGLDAIAEGAVDDSSSVLVYRSTSGKGGFALEATLHSGLLPVAVAALDWNGDGHTDLVVAERNSNTLAVWQRKAKGGYEAAHTIALDSSPTDLAAGDLNGDGRADLAVTIGSGVEGKTGWGLAVWLAGGGDTPQHVARFDNTMAFRLVLADVNHDGTLDAVGQARDGIQVLHGRGDGSFIGAEFIRLEVGSSFAIARLDGDDRLDLACVNPSGLAISLLYGNATGGFGDSVDFDTGAGPAHLATVDADGDGTPDLVTANGGEGTVSVLRNRGGGAFTRTDYPTGDGPTFVAGGDLDGDGDADLVVLLVRGRASEIVVLRNRGGGAFEEPVAVAKGIDPSSVAIADLNGDGKADLLVTRNNQPEVLVYLGKGDATFGAPSKVPLAHLPNVFTTGDLNGDGKLDFVVADTHKKAVTACLGKGDGTFAATGSIQARFEPGALALADTNGDTKPDLVIGGRRQSFAACVLDGVGDGTFGKRTDIDFGPGPGALQLADLDGDGILELAVPDAQLGAVSVITRDQDGGFGARTDYGTGIDPVAVAIADFDGDERLDIAVCNRGVATVSLLRQRDPGAQ